MNRDKLVERWKAIEAERTPVIECSWGTVDLPGSTRAIEIPDGYWVVTVKAPR